LTIRSFEAFEFEGRFFLNPGSATGAFLPGYVPVPSSMASASNSPKTDTHAEAESTTNSPSSPDAAATAPAESTTIITTTTPSSSSTDPPRPTPSFALLDIQGTVVVTYVYQLVQGEVKVDKIEFRGGNRLAA
jgi:vacuolar protein sorting-associated protein 29